MPNINMSSIMSKAKSYVNSKRFQNKAEKKVDDIVLHKAKTKSFKSMDAKTAAKLFIQELQNELESLENNTGFYINGRIGSSAVNTLSQLEYGNPHKITSNQYTIDISFSEDLHRDSIAPNRVGNEDGVINIAHHLDKGYSATKRTFGVWKNHTNHSIPTLREREGTGFIQHAIDNFMLKYAKEYGILDVKKDSIYEDE